MKKIFVGIDDSKVNQYILIETASLLGLDSVIAENGQDGLDKIAKLLAEDKIPSIIVVDIHMPVMNGLEFIKRIKEDVKTKYIPILVLTTEIALEPKMMAKDYGVAGWMIKPLSPEDLKKVLLKFI